MSVSDDIIRFREAGFAIHWLYPNTKRPIGNEWQAAHIASADELRSAYRTGNNVGVRLGQYSALVSGGFLHALDIDIRVDDLADEAWETLESLFPGIDFDRYPCVASGSGGESRHLYVVLDQPFRSKMLATSDGKFRNPATGKWSNEWEIELYGTDKQVVLPPSIHPDSGLPYQWLRPFDLDGLALGDAPTIPAALLAGLDVVEDRVYDFETRDALTFKPGQLDKMLSAIDVSALDYDDWIRLGQAIHHQEGGSDAGFALWLSHTKRSVKYDNDDRTMRMKYRSFGRYRRQPVTMATIVAWAQEARVDRFRDAFDEEPDESPPPVAAAAPIVDPIDALGDDTAPAADLDDLLGGNTVPAAAEIDPIDAMGDGSADPAAALDWVSLLDLNEEGATKPTLHNIELIIANDKRLIGLPQLNDFTHETVQRSTPGTLAKRRKNSAKETRQLSGKIWDVKDTLNGELWSDDRDHSIRSIIEAPSTQGGYGIKVSDRDLKAAIILVSNKNVFHPVREYLTKTAWDGVPRAESLFIDYLGAEDNSYTRSVGRLLLTAAVTRIFEPGHKWDFAVIMEGLQGKRKSTFIEILGRSWFAELTGDFHDTKSMVELMQGCFIMEIPELSGFGRADVRTIKAFISTRKDRARLAYARRAGEFPRQCVFIGTTNDREYLKDDTGGRRFWPMLCSVDEIDTARLEQSIDQIWAEALTMYQGLRASQPHGTLPLYLTDKAARDEAARLQESRRVESADDAMTGRISAWLDRPVSNGGMEERDDEPRLMTCLLQIHVEALGGTMQSYNQATAQLLGRAMGRVSGWSTSGSAMIFESPYGRQRFYSKDGLTLSEYRMTHPE